MRLRAILPVLLLLAVAAWSQQQQPAAATLMQGFGDNHHHPVTTSNEAAQRFFDQGLRLIYGFNHDEAAKAFRRATELDPNMAMAYWGVALAVGPNYNLPVDPEREKIAYDSIQKALSLAPKASAVERAYIEALAKRYTNAPNPDYRSLAIAYKDAMRAVLERYPDDLDAATLYAESIMNLNPWKLWNKDGTPWEGTLEAIRVLESVMQRDPEHIGANHYYIHAVEASSNPARGLAAANRLASLAPSSGHLVHMPAHIYIRTGDYRAARQTNVDAAKADEAYIRASNTAGIYPLMYYSHNLHFIASAAMMEGRFADARDAADRLVRNVSPHLKDMPALETFTLMPVAVLLRFEKWDDILKIPQPDAAMKASNAMWHYARGMALASQDRVTEANKEAQQLASALQATPPDAIWAMPFNNKTKDLLTIANHVLAGKIAMAKQDTTRAVDEYQRAVMVEDSLNYGEPPDWYFPVREALGTALLARGDYKRAEEVFRADLQQHPRNGRSLFGLSQSLKAQGRNDDDAFVQRQFEVAWKDADTPLKPVEIATEK